MNLYKPITHVVGFHKGIKSLNTKKERGNTMRKAHRKICIKMSRIFHYDCYYSE